MKYVAILAALALGGCATTQTDRQSEADQVFGKAKIGLVLATGVVSVYNLMPVCGDGSPSPPLCYSEAVGEIANRGLAALSDAISSAEKVFAAANADGVKLDAAKAASAAVQELLANLAKYGLTALKSG